MSERANELKGSQRINTFCATASLSLIHSFALSPLERSRFGEGSDFGFHRQEVINVVVTIGEIVLFVLIDGEAFAFTRSE